MSNKFLPFIVEKSTAINIYKTLLSRSKGMNGILITSIFHLVMLEGVINIRKTVKTFPDMPVEKMYEELIGHYQNALIKEDELELFLSFSPHFDIAEPKWETELNEFSTIDMLAFFLVMTKVNKICDVTKYDFNRLYDEKARETILSNIKKYTNFSDSGKPMVFCNDRELKIYILYTIIFTTSDFPCIRAVFSEKTSNDST